MELVQDTLKKSTRMSRALIKAGHESASGYGAISKGEKQYQRKSCLQSSDTELQARNMNWAN
jgi:hypothetical protein